MPQPKVEIVIPHHDPQRQIGRAIRSVVAHSDDVCAIVVCHNLAHESFEPELVSLTGDERSRVKVVHLDDGTRNPGGPFNAGLDEATAPFVGILGSDDFYEPGAVLAMAEQAEADGADAVLAPLYMDSGRWVATPRVRPGRRLNLDYVKDRLAYRTAPLGVMRRQVIDDRDMRMTEGITSGVDIAFSTELFTAGHRIDLAHKRHAYVIGTDAPSRVTFASRPLSEEMEAVEQLAVNPLLTTLTGQQREALAIKIVRIHLLGTLARRTLTDQWHVSDLQFLKSMQRRWQDIGGGRDRVLRPFNRADRAVLDLLEVSSDLAEINDAVRFREFEASTVAKILTPRLRNNFHRESTSRAIIAEKINRLVQSR